MCKISQINSTYFFKIDYFHFLTSNFLIFLIHSTCRETGKIDLQRSWFLPLLSRAVPQKPIALSIFHKHILPLADRALAVATVYSSATVLSDKTKPPNNALITLSIKVACQLWSSLNMFVHHSPIDWSELSTGGLGCRLVKELNSAPALRPIILHTFRRLAKLAVGNGKFE